MTVKRAQAARKIMELASHRPSLEHILIVRNVVLTRHLHVGRFFHQHLLPHVLNNPDNNSSLECN